MAEPDETRRRLLEAAGPLFANKGYDAVTVRDITEAAGANLAAVNYHFGGKESLYVDAVRHAARIADEYSPLPAFPAGMPAEERLRGFILAFVRRILASDGPDWHRTLIFREVAEPRPGACEGFVRDFVRPNFLTLLEIVSVLAPPDTPPDRLRMMTGSIIGQVLHYHHCRHVIGFLMQADGEKTHTVETLADHIHRFSLAALRGYAKGGMP